MHGPARTLVVWCWLGGAMTPGCPQVAAAEALARYEVAGDAIPLPLDGRAGDAQRGRAIVLDRTSGNCLICHKVPVAGEPFQGELGPDLTGIGARLTPAQLRLRLVDQSRLDPATLMPPYYRVENLTRVAPAFEGKPVLSAQQIEDVVAWLSGLKEREQP
jgi:L-cysteine S-thiosulfotransferase